MGMGIVVDKDNSAGRMPYEEAAYDL